MNQLTFFDEDTPQAKPPRRRRRRAVDPRRIEKAFRLFDEKHPEVYSVLLDLIGQVRARGHARYSMKALFERLRWHFDMERESNGAFLLNNNFHSYYARKVMQEKPELRAFFEIRELAAREPTFNAEAPPLKPGRQRDQMEGIE